MFNAVFSVVCLGTSTFLPLPLMVIVLLIVPTVNSQSFSSSMTSFSLAASMASSRVSYLALVSTIFATLLEGSSVSPPSVLPVPDVEESPLSVPPVFSDSPFLLSSLSPVFVSGSLDVSVLLPLPLVVVLSLSALESLSWLPPFAPSPAA